MSATSDFVGTGWAFPLRVGPRGGIALDSEDAAIRRALHLIIATAPGERAMRPEFGCRIWDLLFGGTDPNTLGLMAQTVRDAIARWEARVDLEDVATRVDPDDPARVLIDVTYVVRSTNDRRNLVYPFYVIPKEEER
jgi:phage baseplate assembly protein W